MSDQIQRAIDALRAAQLATHCSPGCYAKLNNMIHDLREMLSEIEPKEF